MTFSKIQSPAEFDYKKLIWQLNNKLSTYFNKHKENKHGDINPFMYTWNLPWYQWMKMIFVTITIIPFRVVGFLISFGIAYLLAFIALIGEPNIDAKNPLTGWRKNIVLPLFLVFARMSFFFGSVHWIKVKGERCTTQEAPILVLAPHSAFMDSLFVVFLGMNSVIGKTETANSAVGYLLRLTQPILVTREDPNSRQNTIDKIKKRCHMPENWPQMLIFPEGTCTNRSCLINFKTGAFIPGFPIQPVVLRWPNIVDCITWTWDGPGVWTLLWMMFSQFHTFVEIEFLPVYHPNDKEKQNPQLFADNVRSLMAKALSVPTTNYSYEDCRHMSLARTHGLPFTEVVVEFSKLQKQLLSSQGDTTSMLNRLLELLHRSDDGKVTFHQFRRYVCMLNNDALVERVFKFYDKQNSDLIDMADFFCHLALYSLPFQRKLAMEYTMKGYRLASPSTNIPLATNILQKAFMLIPEEASEVLSFVQLHHSPDQSFLCLLDTVLTLIGGSYNMYSNYQSEYNKSIKVLQKPAPNPKDIRLKTE